MEGSIEGVSKKIPQAEGKKDPKHISIDQVHQFPHYMLVWVEDSLNSRPLGDFRDSQMYHFLWLLQMFVVKPIWLGYVGVI